MMGPPLLHIQCRGSRLVNAREKLTAISSPKYPQIMHLRCHLATYGLLRATDPLRESNWIPQGPRVPPGAPTYPEAWMAWIGAKKTPPRPEAAEVVSCVHNVWLMPSRQKTCCHGFSRDVDVDRQHRRDRAGQGHQVLGFHHPMKRRWRSRCFHPRPYLAG